MAECGDGDSSNGRPYRTHERLWTWQQHEEGGTGAHGRLRAWQQQWEARNLPAPYDKMEPTSSVRRPESGTWQSVCRWRRAAMGGRTGTHETLWTSAAA
ncbi:unnamed protein product [Staurois parvus]|uniref:Uncharacterized protein n=1 Tax=Staurois parvus TaxID=386267 RepID=A0ABN9AP89_9NEOB|nr:unnamed protein product [Staurois parvus]